MKSNVLGRVSMCLKGLLSLSFLSASAVTYADSAVWKVSKNNDVIYLGGTIHALPSTAYPLPKAYDIAYGKSQEIILEVAELNHPDVGAKALAHGVYQNGVTLSSKLSPSTISSLDKALGGYGLNLASVDILKPGMLMAQLTMLELQRAGFESGGVDSFYQAKANEDAKPVLGLETIDEQLIFLTNLGKGNEDTFIRKLLNDLPESKEKMKELLLAWRNGNMNQLEKVFNQETKENFPDLYQSLVVKRNNAWIPKIEQLFGDKNTEFVLVGAGHLSGDVGLLKQLADKGYKLEQM
ncbi:TraB/GumN family protein [Veronia pacifica]|uniref:Polysaccharide biosynthesis protein GumN n=1 Tax=Veronia pacifica TaxID=1080227 RepID=A0A1C3ERF0_9GAMM|nr:TraB/GumN family protein [Veronia pacifica]ODA35796.1 hypothetical protein A8L45_01795 [Veronia pacifica]